MKNKLIILLLALIISANSAFAANYYESGKNFYKNKNYVQANLSFKKALSSDPYNADYRYYYAQTLVYLLRLDEAQKEYEKIIELAPLSSAAKLSVIAIANIQKYYAGNDIEDESESKPSIDGIGENYIDNALDGGLIVRWNLEKMPLKLYLGNYKDVSGYQSYYGSAVKRAFSDWINKLDGLMNYTLVSNPNDADIVIKFVPAIDTTNTGSGFISGLTSHHIKGNILKYANIEVSTMRPNKTIFTETDIYYTVLHEIGHALGIMGHSYNEDDVMYPVAIGKKSVNLVFSHRDVNTIKLLYKLDADISNFDAQKIAKKDFDKNSLVLGDSNSRLDKELQEAKDYVKRVPNHPIAWTSLGSAYNNKKQYYEAITNYKNALEIDANYLQAREGLADSYKDVGDVYNATTEYKNLITSDPKNINYSLKLALLYRSYNKYQDANMVLNYLINANPEARTNEDVKRLMLEVNK
ncbi:MAG: hypothetical protein A2255_08700 [Candidatus Melainabacteria bacterium RIFOXYA2_FULL_32_9]|nr:MAG: hypothetical protein A2255_08700 [Candidatus Melainabacteria bacterium RIFOXYA2_FULL_32_9]